MESELFKSNASDYGEKRNVVLGVTGSIAAYKAVEVARILVSWGYSVRCIMTEGAQKFITPLTLATITGNPVITEFWTEEEVTGVGHIKIADWAEVFLIAPATADCLAKLANGFADSPLLAAVLASKAKLLLAPAMNVNMWEHLQTKENVIKLKSRGATIIEPEVGDLACGWIGNGRLADPMQIFYEVRKALSMQDYAGKHVLISTGPTREALDPVRFLTNRSSGKMGIALAREAFRRGAEVTLLHGPILVRVPRAVRCLAFSSASELEKLAQAEVFEVPAERQLKSPDIVIMAAAVSDVRPSNISMEKIKKNEMSDSIKISVNNDILAEVGKRRASEPRPVLVGFAVETGEIEDLIAEARRKLSTKAIDLIVGNFAQEAFDLDTNRIWLIDKAGRQEEVATTYKSRVANRILDAVQRL